MLVGHLLCGLVLGMLAAAASLYSGHPLWAIIVTYVISVNIGLFGSLFLRSASEARSLDEGSTTPEPCTAPSS